MLHRLSVACAVLALFAGFSASRAKADTTNVVTGTTYIDNYDFTISGNSYTWSIPLPPAVSNVDSVHGAFDVTVPYSLNNGAATLGAFDFYATSDLGGFALTVPATGIALLNLTGPQLFTGPVSAPTLSLGSFTGFTDLVSGETDGALTVTQSAVTATPEPGTLLLTGIGLLGLFWIARRKKKQFNLAV